MEMAVVSLMPTDGLAYPVELRRFGVEVTDLGLTTRWDPRAIRRAATVLRRLAPDIVHTHLKHADLVGALIAPWRSAPMVSTLHRIEVEVSAGERAKRWAGAQARMRAAARTIAVSEAQRQWYLANFPVSPDEVVTVRNGVRTPPILDQAAREQLRASFGVPPRAVLAAMVGLMRPDKGHRTLVDAVARLEASSDVWFLLVGDGPVKSELEDMVAALGPRGRRVIFAGYRTDVDALIQTADLMVHPSLDDALPTALIHGLANGRPAVASAVGGIPEIVTRDTGVLVPPRDPAALAAAMAELAGDEARRRQLGECATQRFYSEFHVEPWARRLRTVYEEALARRRG